MPSFLGTRAVDNGPYCHKCGIRAVRFTGTICRICDREERLRFIEVAGNVFMLVIGVLLLTMATSCAFDTWGLFR